MELDLLVLSLTLSLGKDLCTEKDLQIKTPFKKFFKFQMKELPQN